MVMRTQLIFIFALFSCGTQFLPETLVTDLRVLAIVSEPPEVAPGQPSTLSVLYTDPSRRGPTSVLWVGCEPDPQDLGRSACNDATILLKPTTITNYPEGLQLLGFGTSASYKSTSTVFNTVDPASTMRQAGTVGQILSLVIGEEVDPLATEEKLKGYFARIESKETQAVVALTRVLVSEKSVEKRNKNPRIESLFVNGIAQPKGVRLQFEPQSNIQLDVKLGSGASEPFDEIRSTGTVAKQEAVTGSWYSSHGRFSAERFDALFTNATTFYPPGVPQSQEVVPEKRSGTIWLVIRDSRSGQAFQTYPFFICDRSAKTPEVTSLTQETDGTLIAHGKNTDGILDVIIGDDALPKGAYNVALDVFIGEKPALPKGTYPIAIRTKNCATIESGLQITLP
jgi:hypothetical protein